MNNFKKMKLVDINENNSSKKIKIDNVEEVIRELINSGADKFETIKKFRKLLRKIERTEKLKKDLIKFPKISKIPIREKSTEIGSREWIKF